MNIDTAYHQRQPPSLPPSASSSLSYPSPSSPTIVSSKSPSHHVSLENNPHISPVNYALLLLIKPLLPAALNNILEPPTPLPTAAPDPPSRTSSSSSSSAPGRRRSSSHQDDSGINNDEHNNDNDHHNNHAGCHHHQHQPTNDLTRPFSPSSPSPPSSPQPTLRHRKPHPPQHRL